MGTSATYEYGSTTSSSILTTATLEVNSNPTECRNGVIAFEGNMSAIKYRYVEVALAGPNAGKVIETTNKYQVNIQIDSFDQKGPSLIPEVFLIGNENFTNIMHHPISTSHSKTGLLLLLRHFLQVILLGKLTTANPDMPEIF